jgi:hypothetical protein
MRRRGSRGRKDSFPLSRVKEPGPARTRDAMLAETRPSPFLRKQEEEGEDVAGSVGRVGHGVRPGSGGRNRTGSSTRPGSAGKRADSKERQDSAASTGDQPASLQWPRTNPFARLLHPGIHGPAQAQGGPGLIHAISMEPTPQPPAGLGLSPNVAPRPRSVSTYEGHTGSLPESQELVPVPTPKDDVSRWRFFRPFTRDSVPPVVVAEPEPEPEPEVVEERKRGDIVCVSYGTLDDKAMQQLGGRSDHRPVIGEYECQCSWMWTDFCATGTYTVYI